MTASQSWTSELRGGAGAGIQTSSEVPLSWAGISELRGGTRGRTRGISKEKAPPARARTSQGT